MATESEPYILIYCIYAQGEAARKFDAYASELSRKTGLKVIRFYATSGQVVKRFFRKETRILLPPVFDIISLIDNARYVLTDSFHGTAFSLNLTTEPICIFTQRGTRSSSTLSARHRTPP